MKDVVRGRFLNIGVDSQHYTVNWSNKDDRRLTVIPAITSVDNVTQYCLGMHFCFDGSLKQKELEELAKACRDAEKPSWAREYAQYWLDADLTPIEPAQAQPKAGNNPTSKPLNEILMDDQKLPDKGVQIHSEYTLLAHFRFLSDILEHCRFAQYSLDRESGILRAFVSAFGDRILKEECLGFYVAIAKGLSNDVRRGLVGQGVQLLKNLAGSVLLADKASEDRVKSKHLADIIEKTGLEEWLENPLHRVTEPHKSTKLILAPNLPNILRLAKLHLYSSLHSIDSLFNAIRRSISYLERPVSTKSNSGRGWSGKQPYSPSMIEKVLTIHRTYYNYIKVGGDKNTPAMRIGLADAPLKVEDVMYFDPYE